MILIPLAVGLLCLCFADAWRQKWKNAFVYLEASVIALLLYVLWAQSHVTDYQETEIDGLSGKLTETEGSGQQPE